MQRTTKHFVKHFKELYLFAGKFESEGKLVTGHFGSSQSLSWLLNEVD